MYFVGGVYINMYASRPVSSLSASFAFDLLIYITKHFVFPIQNNITCHNICSEGKIYKCKQTILISTRRLTDFFYINMLL